MNAEIRMPSACWALTDEEIEYDGGISDTAKNILIGLAIGVGAGLLMTGVVGVAMGAGIRDTALIVTGISAMVVCGATGAAAGYIFNKP